MSVIRAISSVRRLPWARALPRVLRLAVTDGVRQVRTRWELDADASDPLAVDGGPAATAERLRRVWQGASGFHGTTFDAIGTSQLAALAFEPSPEAPRVYVEERPEVAGRFALATARRLARFACPLPAVSEVGDADLWTGSRWTSALASPSPSALVAPGITLSGSDAPAKRPSEELTEEQSQQVVLHQAVLLAIWSCQEPTYNQMTLEGWGPSLGAYSYFRSGPDFPAIRIAGIYRLSSIESALPG